MCIRGGRWVSGDPLEAVRGQLGMAFRKPEFGKRKYFILPFGKPIVPPFKGKNISVL